MTAEAAGLVPASDVESEQGPTPSLAVPSEPTGDTPSPVGENSSRVIRLWWHCTECSHRFDLFGLSHDNQDDRFNAQCEMYDHVATKHAARVARYSDLDAWLRAGKATNRVVKHSILTGAES